MLFVVVYGSFFIVHLLDFERTEFCILYCNSMYNDHYNEIHIVLLTLYVSLTYHVVNTHYVLAFKRIHLRNSFEGKGVGVRVRVVVRGL